MDITKIRKRYNKYVESCKKRCEDADVSLGRNRISRIESACTSKILWEEGPNLGTIDTINLLWTLIYGNHIENLIPDGITLLNKIPKE